MKFILWAAVAISLGAGILQARILVSAEQDVKQITFHSEPEYDWVRCTCPSGKEDPAGYWPPSLGLSQGDFIEHQKEMERLKHAANKCNY